jgi:hypothetical protein
VSYLTVPGSVAVRNPAGISDSLPAATTPDGKFSLAYDGQLGVIATQTPNAITEVSPMVGSAIGGAWAPWNQNTSALCGVTLQISPAARMGPAPATQYVYPTDDQFRAVTYNLWASSFATQFPSYCADFIPYLEANGYSDVSLGKAELGADPATGAVSEGAFSYQGTLLQVQATMVIGWSVYNIPAETFQSLFRVNQAHGTAPECTDAKIVITTDNYGNNQSFSVQSRMGGATIPIAVPGSNTEIPMTFETTLKSDQGFTSRSTFAGATLDLVDNSSPVGASTPSVELASVWYGDVTQTYQLIGWKDIVVTAMDVYQATTGPVIPAGISDPCALTAGLTGQDLGYFGH